MNRPRCYATRLVNPYTGVLQVADDGVARSLSRDGYHWEIQVQVERGAGGWGSLNRKQKELKYYRYALWNPADGLRRMPTDPTLDAEQLQHGCESIVGQLQSGLWQDLPFILADRYELWLLDRQELPLALLASTCDEHLIPQIRERRWRAVSASLASGGYTQTKAEPLEALIRLNAGNRQWFHRQANGEAMGLGYLCPAALAGRVLPAAVFPELLVRAEWDEPTAVKLMDEWFDCLAPWLLQLQGIRESTRRLLEQRACQLPETVDLLHRLYPMLIDQPLINSTRVAAKIKTANH